MDVYNNKKKKKTFGFYTDPSNFCDRHNFDSTHRHNLPKADSYDGNILLIARAYHNHNLLTTQKNMHA